MVTYLAGAGAFGSEQVVLLFLSLAILLGLARFLGELAVRWRQPAILGEILAGVLLGPTVLGSVSPDVYAWLFPSEGAVAYALEGLIIVSTVLLLLVAGLEVELSMVWRHGRSVLVVGAMSMAVPFVLGFGLGWFGPGLLGMGGQVRSEYELPFALFMGIALSITALPVIAKILMDLGLSKSDFGTIVISAAMLNDLLGWIGFAMVLAMIAPHTGTVPVAGAGGLSVAATAIVQTLAFLGGVFLLGKLVLNRALPYLQAHCTWPGGVLSFVMVAALLGAAVTEWIGIHSIFGAFIVGVVIGDSRHVRERTRETIAQFILNIFAPLFFASIGLRVDFAANFDLLATVVVLAVAVAGKLGGCYLGASWSGMSQRDGWAIGLAMNARGAMEIILGQLALTAGVISEQLFVAIVVMAIVTSLISGPAIDRIIRPPRRRRFGDLLTEAHFVPELQARDARGVIAELSERAAEITGLDVSRIDRAVWAREMVVRTGLEHGLAVPHARLPGLDGPVLIIGRSPEGVDFDAPDGEPARFICMILTPVEDPASQLECLRLVAGAFSDPEALAQALETDSFRELLAVLTLAKTDQA